MNDKNPTYILGVHDGHNASVCLLMNGRIIYAMQEERLRNIKNYFGFPTKSVKAALSFENLSPAEIDQVAVASKHMSRPENVLHSYRKESTIDGKVRNIIFKTPLYDLYKNYRRKDRKESFQKAGFPENKIHFVEHHLCHASAVYYGLPVPKHEKILVLTLDGSGDGLCATVNIGENGELMRIASTDKGNSIGNIYSRVTFMLGFVPWEHEYKLMGMAPYVSEKNEKKAYEVFKNYIDISENNPLIFERKTNEPTNLIYHHLREDCELLRFDSICAGLQKLTEEVICKWVRNCIKETGIRKIALSGGVFMNVKANKRIMEIEEVDNLFIMPSCGDETNSFGAAYRVFYENFAQNGNGAYPVPFHGLYLGNDIDDLETERVLNKCVAEGHKFKYQYFEDIESEVADILAGRNVVARCKGRMEFGARALGNRSILADPSALKLIREINLMVKSRDFWMPFAPVILEERADEYIKNPKDFDAPYMILSFDSRDKQDEFIAALHQADLTARPQIIDEERNPTYYRILKKFEKTTGRGVLLNTSFNLHGYPIVNGPKEAMWVFLNSGLKYLAVGNYLVSKVQ